MENIKNLLEKYHLTLLKYNNSQNVLCEDINGYKYKIIISNLKRRGLPSLFKANPYAKDNLIIYLSKNQSSLIPCFDKINNCKEKLGFLCPKHIDKGVQFKTLDYIINKNCKCKYCNIEERGCKKRTPDSVLISKSSNIGVEYIGRKIKNGETWVMFSCPKHKDKGVQSASWTHFKTSSLGCSFCAGKHIQTNNFVKEIKEINKYIEIIGEYRGCEKKILCKCLNCGHEWFPIARSLRNGQGCPKCCQSKGEREIERFLINYKVEFITEATFDECRDNKKLRFDFYLPKFKTVVEYDGKQHFAPVKFGGVSDLRAEQNFRNTVRYDKIKNDFCQKNNIKIIRISYKEYNNIEKILKKELNK